MWQILLTAALLFQSPPQAAGPAPAAPTPADLVQQGTDALNQGNYAAAAEVLTRAVAAAPDDYFAHFNLAVAYSLLGDDPHAIPEYRKVLELKPGLYEASINLGQVLVRSGDPASAIPLLAEARRQKPDEVRPAYYLAEAYAATNQPEQAVDPYTAAIALNPNDASSELGLARVLFELGRFAEADPHYHKAAELDPNLKSYLLELATGYEEHGNPTAALKIFREFPGDPAVEERMGVILLQSGDLEGAIAALEAAVKGSPTKGNQTALVQAYMDHKDVARAEALMQQVIAAEPKDFNLRMYYGRLLRDDKKIVPAGQQFEAATQIKPEDAQAWSELAGMLILNEQYPAALAALDRARDLGLEGPGHIFFRATTLDHLQAWKEALEYYQKFLEADQGANPDQEFQARQRVLALKRDLGKR